MHAVHRRTIDRHVSLKIRGMSAMVPAATVILETRSSSVSTMISYTSCYMCLQRKKSRHVRSVDLVARPQGHPGPSIDSRRWLSDDSSSEMGWRPTVLEVHPLSNIQEYILQQFWQHTVHEIAISPSVEAEWKNVWSNQTITDNAGPHFNIESLLMSTCTQSSFECQYTFLVNDTDTTAYVSTTNKMFPNNSS